MLKKRVSCRRMGKLSKKTTPSKGSANQQKISSFFQGKPVQKRPQLFSTVHDASNRSKYKTPEKTIQGHQDDPIVIPETQLPSPNSTAYNDNVLTEKQTNQIQYVRHQEKHITVTDTCTKTTVVDLSTPDKQSGLSEDASLSDSEDTIIPDTPQQASKEAAGKRKIYHRSFLKPVSKLSMKAGLANKSMVNPKQHVVRKKTKARLTPQSISSGEKKMGEAGFNSILCQSGIDIQNINVVHNSTHLGIGLSELSKTKDELTSQFPLCKKRSSNTIKGESPDPKRTSLRQSSPMKNSTGTKARINLNWGDDSTDLKEEKVTKTKSPKYQICTSMKNRKIENKVLVGLDIQHDQHLSDILGELKENEGVLPLKSKKSSPKSKQHKQTVLVDKSDASPQVVDVDLNKDTILNDIITELRDQSITSGLDTSLNSENSQSLLQGYCDKKFLPIHLKSSSKTSTSCENSQSLLTEVRSIKDEQSSNCSIGNSCSVLQSTDRHGNKGETQKLHIAELKTGLTDCEDDKPIKEPSMDNANDVSKMNEKNLNSDAMDGITEMLLDESMTDDLILNANFSQISPFKSSQFPQSQEEPPCRQFGRHIVTDVQYTQDHSICLSLRVDGSNADVKKTCILQGYWCDSYVKSGDIVHIIGEFDETNTCTITDQSGLIIINPDLLISGTSVVGSVHCMRRAVLNEKFKGSEGKNIHMLYGSIIHSFFQQVVQEKHIDEKTVQQIAEAIVSHNTFLQDMYGQGVSEASVMEEIQKYVPQLLKFANKYMPPKQHVFGQSLSEKVDKTIVSVVDIEENVWSPRYGIKGKIDLTVEIKLHKERGRHTLMPLELKTGKPTYSVEHKGQVTLYSMMSCDRRTDPEGGLLLYLREGEMNSIPADHANKRGLLQLRNELAHYILHSMEKSDEDTKHRCAHLPRPINNPRTCSKCPQLINCALYQRSIEQYSAPSGHGMHSLVPETLAHLSIGHVDFFSKWCHMLHLEMKADRKTELKNIWCKTARQREQTGEAISNLVLSNNQENKKSNTGFFYQSFNRRPGYHSKKPLSSIGLSEGMSVTVSAENRTLIALSYGTVHRVEESSLHLLLDRNLGLDPDHQHFIYRVDRCDIYNSMATNFTNLSRLMLNDVISEKLRKIIIDKEKPRFDLTLSKGDIEKVKPIFKKLNKPQKAAILKVLMCQDFVLIKGYPGTGKTSTIVSLVRILQQLGRTVLLTSYTHSAVDNILLKLKQYDVDFLRIGKRDRIHRDILPYSAENLTSKLTTVEDIGNFYASKSVVATTCLGTSHVLFTKRVFDVCIVDEASQVLQLACLGPLFCSKKFVLVGDPKQLPPIVQSTEAKQDGMDESLFMRLDGSGATYELNLQYRMNSEIMSISNMLMYDGALQCGNQAVANDSLQVKLPDQQFAPWIAESMNTALDHSVLFLDTDKVQALEMDEGKGCIRNEKEAHLVLKLVQSFKQCGLVEEDIGIISPYRHQVQHIHKLLIKEGFTTVEVNTVDQYQGRDKKVIIVSFVRSNTQDGAVSMILHDDRRLNVAVTRAKHKLLMLGSRSTLQHYPAIHKILTHLKPHQIISLTQGCLTEVLL